MQAVPRQLQHINTPTAGRVTGDANTDTAVQHQAAQPICATDHPPTRQQSSVTLTRHSMQQGSRGMQAAHRQLQRTINLSTASVTDQADSTDTCMPVQRSAATARSSITSPRRPLQQAGWQHHKTKSRCIAAYIIYSARHMQNKALCVQPVAFASTACTPVLQASSVASSQTDALKSRTCSSGRMTVQAAAAMQYTCLTAESTTQHMRLLITVLTGGLWHAPTTDTTATKLIITKNPSTKGLPANSCSCFNDVTDPRLHLPDRRNYRHCKLLAV
jgi:hypothetical protein